jgi:hypothetical protein
MIEYFWTCNRRTEHEVNLMPEELEGKVIPVTSFCGIELPNGVKSGTAFSHPLAGSEPCKECRAEKKRLVIDSVFLKQDKRDFFTQRINELLSTVPGDIRKGYNVLSDGESNIIEPEGQSRPYEFRTGAVWLFNRTDKLVEYRHYREWEDDVISDQLSESSDYIYLFSRDPLARRVFECMIS